jgi:heme oxygenase (mycobilin-producing)
VSEARGFESFELLRPNDDGGDAPGPHLLALRGAFQAWVASPDFAAGHAKRRESGSVCAASELWSFDVLEWEGPAAGGVNLRMAEVTVCRVSARKPVRPHWPEAAQSLSTIEASMAAGSPAGRERGPTLAVGTNRPQGSADE